MYEVVDNSVDEALLSSDHIEIVLQADGSALISDNGRVFLQMFIQGLEKCLRNCTYCSSCGGKFGSGGYKVSGGLHGVGYL